MGDIGQRVQLAFEVRVRVRVRVRVGVRVRVRVGLGLGLGLGLGVADVQLAFEAGDVLGRDEEGGEHALHEELDGLEAADE